MTLKIVLSHMSILISMHSYIILSVRYQKNIYLFLLKVKQTDIHARKQIFKKAFQFCPGEQSDLPSESIRLQFHVALTNEKVWCYIHTPFAISNENNVIDHNNAV